MCAGLIASVRHSLPPSLEHLLYVNDMDLYLWAWHSCIHLAIVCLSQSLFVLVLRSYRLNSPTYVESAREVASQGHWTRAVESVFGRTSLFGAMTYSFDEDGVSSVGAEDLRSSPPCKVASCACTKARLFIAEHT